MASSQSLVGLQSLLFLFTLFTHILCQTPGSTFVLKGGDDANFSISVNVPSNPTNDDIFFHISAPAGQAWVGWGFGDQMQDSLLFVAYPSADGKNITLSPRVGIAGHHQPQVTTASTISLLPGSYINRSKYFINAQCTGCRSWPIAQGEPGTVDVSSISAPMLYAIGDDKTLIHSDDVNANIEQHQAYGTFTIDLKAATGNGGVPSEITTEKGVTHNEESQSSRQSVFLHGMLMSAAFVLLFPVGGVLIRLPFHIALWAHICWQIMSLMTVFGGVALGMYVTIKHQKYPNLNTPHQVLGFAVVALVTLVQPFLGLIHHHTYKKAGKATRIGKIHRYCGPLFILLGIVNGSLGLSLADHKERLPAYFGIVIFVSLCCLLGSWVLKRRNLHKKAVTSVAASNFREGATRSPSTTSKGGATAQTTDVPLETYKSQPTTPGEGDSKRPTATPLQQTFSKEHGTPEETFRPKMNRENSSPRQNFDPERHGSPRMDRGPDRHGSPRFDNGPERRGSPRPGPPRDNFGPGGPGGRNSPRQNFRPPPRDNYGPPPPQNFRPHDNRGPPQNFRPPPQDQYGPPQDQYGPPQGHYGPPQGHYGPPQPEQYGPPQHGWAPQDPYGHPHDQYGPPGGWGGDQHAPPQYHEMPPPNNHRY